MQAGKLNRRIAVHRAVMAEDGAGGQSRDWGDPLFYRRIAARPAGGVQADVGSVLTDQQSYRIEMRRSDIRTGDRVVMKGLAYRVRSVADPDGRGRDMVVLIDLEVPE